MGAWTQNDLWVLTCGNNSSSWEWIVNNVWTRVIWATWAHSSIRRRRTETSQIIMDERALDGFQNMIQSTGKRLLWESSMDQLCQMTITSVKRAVDQIKRMTITARKLLNGQSGKWRYWQRSGRWTNLADGDNVNKAGSWKIWMNDGNVNEMDCRPNCRNANNVNRAGDDQPICSIVAITARK